MQTLNSILVYIDLSPASAEAVRAAKALARATHAALEVVRVVGDPLAADWTAEMSTAGLPAVQEAMETEAQEWLEEALG
ncbi:MAG: universal stress protein, partial [Acidobacteria bacterium]